MIPMNIVAAPSAMRGNRALAELIREAERMKGGAAEKVEFLIQGVAKIEGIQFTRLPQSSSAYAIFQGMPISDGDLKGQSPILAVLMDGRIVKGYNKLHLHHSRYFVVDVSDLREKARGGDL